MILSPDSGSPSAASFDPAVAHAAWQTERLSQVSGRTGAAALINYVPLDATEQKITEFPLSARRIQAEAGVRVRAHTDGITLRTSAGITELAPGVETLVDRLGSDGLPLIEFGRFTIDAFSLDGTDVELRIYDAEAENLRTLTGIETNPYDPAWVLTGTFHAGEPDARVPWGFTRESDNGHTKAVPGTIAIRVGEADYSLLVFADGPALVLVFADATTGSISYAPGRFIRLDPVPDGDPIVLDFNRAFVPPCGFSDFFSCPIPPAHNRIAAAVIAGENRAQRAP
ncbi:DUF1684 domain-containing protein [Mycetocola lacteus]|uniref:DUF1684 domain-containing protein n=1 Tax=Mycetocola lacteus TaxID=76637 RepID=A0A3L7AUH8_9MICO|nr:DUF1684 domain-containing protein [Mycetocola lacteus]RLP84137.1 DUF1684 domain-containing protein [Mycetocola lacteus]